VARTLGMTVQALYHYFPSRAELITALITESYESLVDAVQAALDAAPETGDPRFVVAAEGFRAWAVGNAPRFQLIYGTPLLDYDAPVEGPSTAGARRLAAIFVRELFAGIADDRLAGIDFPLSPDLRAHLATLPREAVGTLPPPAAALFVSAWGHAHGLVTLEVFGHTAFIGPLTAEIFRTAMLHLLSDTRGRVPVG
jgi:AcrR family transcriptional regulator